MSNSNQTIDFTTKKCSFTYGSKLKKELSLFSKIVESPVKTGFFFMLKSQIFFRWGRKKKLFSYVNFLISKLLGKDIWYIEDGLVRSVEVGLTKSPTMSIIFDNISPYYDANSLNLFQKTLNDINLKEDQIAESKGLIDKIVSNKISKYNNAALSLGSNIKIDKKSILIIDQRYNDASVKSGMADESSFESMLNEAVLKYPDYQIIVKKHPDSKFPQYKSYIDETLLEKFSSKNLLVIDDDVNPYVLFEKVDKVFVVTSQVGFEALMAGKEVHCFGMPFYAGRGLTIDKLAAQGFRNSHKNLNEVFYVAYILLAKYYCNKDGNSGSLNSLVSFIIQNR